MFGIGLPEFIIIAIVALIILGPEKLPEVAKGLAKAMNEFRRAGDEVKKAVIETNIVNDIKGSVEKDVFATLTDDKKSYAHSGAPTKEERESRLDAEKAATEAQRRANEGDKSESDDAKKAD